MFAKRDETSNCSTYSNPSAAVGRALKGLSALKSDQASQQRFGPFLNVMDDG